MKDLTKGNPFKLILFFVLPIWCGYVFQQLYNMADFIIVSNTVGAEAFTGVGLTGSVNFLILGFVNGLTAGFGVRVSQRFGAGDMDGVRKACAMSIWLCIIISLISTAISVPLTAPLLRLMATPDLYFDYAYYYLVTIFWGTAATVFYNIFAGILRAVGDSKMPLVFLITAIILNIGLDFAFIVGLQMHYIGAALATVASQAVAGLACLIYLIKKHPELLPRKTDWKWDFALAGGHIAIGLPMALQFSITAIGCMIQQTAMNGLDADLPGVVTASAAASKIDGIACQSFFALGTAFATYAGQNAGADRYDRVQKGALVGGVYILCGTVIGFIICNGFYSPLMRLFLNTELSENVALYYDDMLAYGRKYLLFQSSFYPLLGIVLVWRNLLQGMGKSIVTTFAGLSELCARILTSFVFVKLWGFTGMCLSNPTAWLAAAVLSLVTYYVIMYKIKRKRGICTVQTAAE